MNQYEAIKLVKPVGNGAYVLVPINLIGKKVFILEI